MRLLVDLLVGPRSKGFISTFSMISVIKPQTSLEVWFPLGKRRGVSRAATWQVSSRPHPRRAPRVTVTSYQVIGGCPELSTASKPVLA